MPQPKPLTTKRCTSLLNRIICTIIHLQRTENSIILTIEEMHSYRRSLVLTQAEFSGDLFPYIYITNYTLTQAQENSVLQLQAVYGTDPNEHCLRIEFAQAYLKDEIFSAMEVPEFQNPWHYLAAIARELEVKDENKVALTPKESALLPLCRALVMLVAYGNWRVDIDRQVLSPLFTEFTWPNRDRIQRRLTRIAKVGSPNTARRWLSSLITELIDQKYEPVWREIYTRLADSQAGLPRRADEPDAFRQQIRQQIADGLHAQGFQGEYPEFHRADSPRKVLHIRCAEEYDREAELYRTLFLCGRSADTTPDSRAWLFSGSLRPPAESFTIWLSPDQPDLDNQLQKIPGIAAKKAAGKELSRKEKAYLTFGNRQVDSRTCFALACWLGLRAGLIMTVGMILVSVLIFGLFSGSLVGLLDPVIILMYLLAFAATTIIFTVLFYFFFKFGKNPL